MTGIKVELVDAMGNDLRVANIARVSFNKWKEELDDKDVKLINYLSAHAHNSPFRHVQVSLRCKAPVFLARQLQKHTVGLSWNEVSRRYVDVGIEFYSPDNWRSRPSDGIKQGSGSEVVKMLWKNEPYAADTTVEEGYEAFLESAYDMYEAMLTANVAPEMARMVLPQSMMVEWVWTGSLEAFFHVYKLRSGEGAQVEAKDFAQLVEDIVSPIFPHCWSALKGEQHGTATN